MTETILPTTVVGSYPQPDWLIDRDKLTALPPARVRASELWRVPEPWLEQAQDDATVLAIRDMERAGIDIITDGEIRRESYSNRFATALSGIDLDSPATVRGRSSGNVVVPRIVARSDGCGRSRCAMSNFCGATPTAASRSPCPARSRCRARQRTNTTRTRKSW
jgi:5-methyltetrahydropteroyltriglutamate--homocysteine methyltransferase